jgi:hypothetical protein
VSTFPGSYAVPGAMQPGAAWPGDVIPGSGGGGGAVSALYTGGEVYTYPQYLDASTGHTLVAHPGTVYGINIASGYVNVGTLPDDGRWIAQ